MVQQQTVKEQIKQEGNQTNSAIVPANPSYGSEEKFELEIIKLGVEPTQGKRVGTGRLNSMFGVSEPVKESLIQALLISSLDKTNRMNVIDCDSAV